MNEKEIELLFRFVLEQLLQEARIDFISIIKNKSKTGEEHSIMSQVIETLNEFTLDGVKMGIDKYFIEKEKITFHFNPKFIEKMMEEEEGKHVH